MASVCKPVCVCLDKLIRNRRGMRLMQDGATSHTAYTTLQTFCKLKESNLPWPSKLPDLNQMSIFRMSLIGWLGDGPFQCKTITAICNAWMESNCM